MGSWQFDLSMEEKDGNYLLMTLLHQKYLNLILSTQVEKKLNQNYITHIDYKTNIHPKLDDKSK